MISDALGKSVSFRVSTNAIRTVEKTGGIDAFLLSAKDKNLSSNAVHVKRAIKAAMTSE
jgi:large subunit ribosomal protein L28